MTTTAAPMTLLPCPFCGGEASLSEYRTKDGTRFKYDGVHGQIECSNEDCQISSANCFYFVEGEEGNEKLDMIEAWNTRTPPTPTIDLAELDDAIYYLQDTNGIMQETDYFEYDKHQNLLIRTAKAYRALFTNQPKGDE